MKRYLKVYKQIFKLNLFLIINDKFSFFSHIISTLSWTFLAIITMFLLTGKAKTVLGWTQGELLLLTGGFTILTGVFTALFRRSFNKFSDTILYGNLDGILIKPIDSQFLISTLHVSLANLLRAIVGVIFIFYVINRFHYHVTILSITSFFLLLFLGLIMFYSIFMIAATLMVWYPRLSNILDLMNAVNHISRYPPEIYREFSTYLFLFVLPYTFIVVTPVKFLLLKASLWDFLGLVIFTFSFFIISRSFWKYALQHYTSASS